MHRAITRSFLLIFLCSASNAFAQTIDSFNPAPNTYPTTLATQSDGKILIAGNFSSVGLSTYGRMARLNVDGSIDTTFTDPAINGNVITVAVQKDGKILVGGDFDAVNTVARHYAARLNSDGTLDTQFQDPHLDSSVWALAIQPDGKVLAAGDFQNVGAVGQKYFARLTTTGALDTSFPDPQLCCNVARAVAIQADGRILIGGNFTQVAGHSSGYAYLARFSSAGALDTTFPNVPDSVVLLSSDIVIAPDASIFLNGTGTPSLRKLNSNGTLNSAFNPAPADSSVDSFVLQPNGKIVIAGTFQIVGGQPRHGMARLNADGSLDGTFGDVNFNLTQTVTNGYVYGIVEQDNGDIVATTNSTYIDGQVRQYMARVVTGDAVASTLTAVAAGSNATVTWTRTGDGMELNAPPTLEHSSDGVNYTTVVTMSRIATGWRATAPYNINGTPFYLRAKGFGSAGADNGSIAGVDSPIYVSDRLFENGFER